MTKKDDAISKEEKRYNIHEFPDVLIRDASLRERLGLTLMKVDLFSSEKKHIKSQHNSKLAAAMENKLKSIKKTYLQKQGVVCPYCGSGNIGEFDHDYDSVIVCDIECFDCDKQWRDYYELHDVELVDEPTCE